MGPRLFSVEYKRIVVDPQKPCVASMGPRLFSVEYRQVANGHSQRASGLQWGHAYSAWNTARIPNAEIAGGCEGFFEGSAKSVAMIRLSKIDSF